MGMTPTNYRTFIMAAAAATATRCSRFPSSRPHIYSRPFRLQPSLLSRFQPLPRQPYRALHSTPPHPQTRAHPSLHDEHVDLHSLDPRHRALKARREGLRHIYATAIKALITGSLAGLLCLFLKWDLDARKDGSGSRAIRAESRLPSGGLAIVGKPVEVVELGGKKERQMVLTGTSTVPGFPKTLHLSEGGSAVEEGEGGREYTLLGLGVRTVSFLSIEVYVVGLYVCLEDAPALQRSLLRVIDPTGTATTAIELERQNLRTLLLDPTKGEEAINELLKKGGFKSVLRIVPVKNTDMAHMRDGWVRAVTAKSQEPSHREGQKENKAGDQFDGEDFGRSMKLFREMLSAQEARRKVPTGRELLLLRDAQGVLRVTLGGDKTEAPCLIGELKDERISRCIWLNYLAGNKVASEGARKSMVLGLLELVERPVGTVETKVE